MTPSEAKTIINDYVRLIKKIDDLNGIVISIDELPYSVGKIKYAHFVYAEELIKQNQLTKIIGDQLIETYGYINKFFVENPEDINLEYRKYLSDLDKKIISNNPHVILAEIALANNIEFNNFLAECETYYLKEKVVKNTMYRLQNSKPN